jgi:uncharacterized protein (DUF1800 family)
MFARYLSIRCASFIHTYAIVLFCGILLGGFNATVTHAQAGVQTITLSAIDGNGNNTSTAVLGVPIKLTATVSAGQDHDVTWKSNDGGSFSTGGSPFQTATFTPPTAMTSGGTITITASLTSASSVKASLVLTLHNPVPTLTSATPSQLIAGGTQTVTLNGTGFVSGTTVLFKGSSLDTSYSSNRKVTVSVPVPGNATGDLSLQVVNPSPGGGSGSKFTETVPTPTITLNAANKDGVNIGTTELGVNVTMSAKVSQSGKTDVKWSHTGSGSISSSGVYTAPTVMPSSSAVTITAKLVSNLSVTATYKLNIVNPAPVITKASLTGVPAGTTTSVTITGTGFLSGTELTTNSGTVKTTYKSSSSLVAEVTLDGSASGTLMLQAQNPSPGGGTSGSFSLPIYTVTIAAVDPDGTNTSTARLGVPVNLTATAFAGQTNEWISWTLSGPGSLHIGGSYNVNATYTPPTTMPSSNTATFTAVVAGLPSLKTTYTVTLDNPVPLVTAATPTKLLTGSTQTVTLTGSGFVPGVVVVMGGKSLTTAYTSPTAISVNVPVAADATGTLSLQVKNPTPGGGAGTTFTETIDTDSIALTATDQDGINTGTAELGISVTMTAKVSGAAQPAVTWSLAGPGSISSSGVYTAPPTIPSGSSNATVTATLVSNPTIAASYDLSVIYPTPTIISASQYVLSNVETNLITLDGTGFEPQTKITTTNGTAVVTYQSPSSLLVKLTVNPGTTGTVALFASNPSPGGGTSAEFDETIASTISVTAATRLLDQTAFGTTPALIQTVQNLGVNGWLAQQFNTPPTLLGALQAPYPAGCGEAIACAESEWWQAVLTGNDQLRQRVAFALSQIFVISTDTVKGGAIPQYANILANDAFTNWFQIMQDVTTSPGMGTYLNMMNSELPTSTQQIPNENFARENMQLFNMGLYLLNQDGSLQTDGNGNPIPSYNENIVQSFARLFTGWTWANADGSRPPWFIGAANYNYPMVPIETSHDQNPKTLLDDQNPTDLTNGTTLPGGQTAEQDLVQGLANVFNHPNVPPFVSRLLIQHFTTSSPSPGYISRVAAVFTNNGNNVRGDMKAVITAILTDPEARAGDINPPVAGWGHLREPDLWLTGVMIGLGAVNIDPNNNYISLSYYTNAVGERPYQASDVFNFFPPDYVIPDTVAPQGMTLNAPEFGIENAGSVMGRLGVADLLLGNYISGFNVDLSATSPLGQLASTNPASMVDQLGLIFMHAQMDPNVRSAILSEIATIPDVGQKVRVASYLVVTSTQYKIVQ